MKKELLKAVDAILTNSEHIVELARIQKDILKIIIGIEGRIKNLQKQKKNLDKNRIF